MDVELETGLLSLLIYLLFLLVELLPIEMQRATDSTVGHGPVPVRVGASQQIVVLLCTVILHSPDLLRPLLSGPDYQLFLLRVELLHLLGLLFLSFPVSL